MTKGDPRESTRAPKPSQNSQTSQTSSSFQNYQIGSKTTESPSIFLGNPRSHTPTSQPIVPHKPLMRVVDIQPSADSSTSLFKDLTSTPNRNNDVTETRIVRRVFKYSVTHEAVEVQSQNRCMSTVTKATEQPRYMTALTACTLKPKDTYQVTNSTQSELASKPSWITLTNDSVTQMPKAMQTQPCNQTPVQCVPRLSAQSLTHTVDRSPPSQQPDAHFEYYPVTPQQSSPKQITSQPTIQTHYPRPSYINSAQLTVQSPPIRIPSQPMTDNWSIGLPLRTYIPSPTQLPQNVNIYLRHPSQNPPSHPPSNVYSRGPWGTRTSYVPSDNNVTKTQKATVTRGSSAQLSHSIASDLSTPQNVLKQLNPNQQRQTYNSITTIPFQNTVSRIQKPENISRFLQQKSSSYVNQPSQSTHLRENYFRQMSSKEVVPAKMTGWESGYQHVSRGVREGSSDVLAGLRFKSTRCSNFRQ